jgi:SNF2 family DNA or RNA helicase
MNIDALCTNAGFDYARRFLLATRAMLALDESSRIKNPAALRTQRLMRLRKAAAYVRIATGTPITNAPVDVFAQFEFMESGLLGTTSYRAFVAEYAELLPATHPLMAALAKRNPKAAFAQMVAKNTDGSPRWRNLDKLQRLLAPHSFRVLKRDCLDLPEKIYQQTYFDLSPAQRAAYRLMDKECRVILEDGEIGVVAKLSAIMKLQQITSGFMMKPERGGLMYVSEENPRLDALLELAADIPCKFIVWARFREELRAVAEALQKAGRRVVQYHGDVSAKDREAAVDDFQNGDADVFVGQPQSGGIGLTLTTAETVVYYSNDYNSETRKQSEDRCHRIGTRNPVTYIDITASDTIDEAIVRALQRKADLAALILGDEMLRAPDGGDN